MDLRAFAWLLCVLAVPAHAHDPSAWGGMYRSRDAGVTWFSIDGGLFVGGAVAVAINPADPNHLLYATDSRLLRSLNGGRDWTQENDAAFLGPTVAVAFHRDGKGAVASTAAGVFSMRDGAAWQDSGAPSGAAPARALVQGAADGRMYLGGPRGVFVSGDYGRSWVRANSGLPEGLASALAVAATPQETVFALTGGDLWASADGAQSWRPANAGLPHGKVDAIFLDEAKPGTLWAAGADQVFTSTDLGATWQAVGQRLAPAGTSVRGMAVSADARIIVLSTHRGVLRSEDGGATWKQVESNLPVHLEASPLARDPRDVATLYTGFSLTPYTELWRRAEEGNNLLRRIDPISLAGGAAFLVLLIAGGVLAARWLIRTRSDSNHSSGEIVR